jgi:hypothetical protein
MKRAALAVHQLFPGVPFVIVVCLPSGALSMGNTGPLQQQEILRGVVGSFDAGTATVTHDGPVKGG